MWTIGSLLELAARKHPRRPAIISWPGGEHSLNYRQWDRQVNALSHGLLALGLARGDRVATFLANSVEMVTVLFAAAKAGGVFNPINYQLSPRELASILNDAEAKILFYGARGKNIVMQARPHVKTVQHYVDVDADPAAFAIPYGQLGAGMPTHKPELPVLENDWYAILYTSGTTRRPRGVIHKHRSIVEHSLCMLQSQKLTCADRGLSLSPLYHVAELHAFLIPRVHAGAANIICRHLHLSDLPQVLEQQQITVLFADPPLWGQILHQVPDLNIFANLRLAASGGSDMSPSLAVKMRQGFSGQIMHYYGATEMGPVMSAYEVSAGHKDGSAGLPFINHQVKVARPDQLYPTHPDDVVPVGVKGEVLVQGVGMMQGYYNHPELTAEALYGGWYHTGDIGYLDRDGYLWLVGRRDDTIVAGVDNIYPQEIEVVLQEHPDIIEAAVVGVPGQHWQTTLLAVVATKNKNLTARELKIFLRHSQRLADYKIPRLYQFVDQLPRVTTGKVQRRKLLQSYSNESKHKF